VENPADAELRKPSVHGTAGIWATTELPDVLARHHLVFVRDSFSTDLSIFFYFFHDWRRRLERMAGNTTCRSL
jgi:hypothetical protein